MCPSTETAPPPNPDDVTENPLGPCRCNGELWISEGCSFGFFCDDSEDIGGYLLICEPVNIYKLQLDSLQASPPHSALRRGQIRERGDFSKSIFDPQSMLLNGLLRAPISMRFIHFIQV